MVHALEQIASWLRPGGQLINIYPVGVPDRAEVRLGSLSHLAGYLSESDHFQKYAQATAAQNKVVDRGLFLLDKMQDFEFPYHADTLADWQAYLAEKGSATVMDEATGTQIKSLLGEPGPDKELIVWEKVRMTRLLLGNL